MKTARKAMAIFLVLLTLFTTCSLSMPAFAAYENVTDGNVISDKVTDGNIPSGELEGEDEPKILSEVVEERSETEKHFLMSDGTFMVAKYSQPVHYQDNNGEWIDYDNTLIESEATTEQTALFGTDEIYSTQNQIENVVFAKKSNSNTLVSYEAKDYPISFNYQSAKKSNIKMVENKETLEGNDSFLTLSNLTQEVLYENVFNKVDLQYFVSTNELKENIILKTKNAQNTFTINYNIGSLTAEVVDSQTINLMSGSKHIYTISAPFMYDADGEKSENVTLAVKKNKNGKLTLVITADSEWLNEENRAFPVTIDPTIMTEQDIDTIATAMIASYPGFADKNRADFAETIVGAEKDYGYCRVLTKFELPQLNKGDIVVSGVLNVYNLPMYYSDGCTFDMQVNAHMIKEGWEYDVVTWNNQPQYELAALDYDIFEDGGNAWRTFDITKAAKAWYAGTANNGIILKSSVENQSIISNGHKASLYIERYNDYEDAYPAIVLTYRNNKGLEDYWTYTSLSAGTAGSAYINDYTGNLVFASNAVSTSNELMPLSIDCIYNGYTSTIADFIGKSSSNQTWLGRGWRFSVQQTVIPSSYYGLDGDSEEAYPYVYTDGDGTEHYIYHNEDDEVYEDEDGLGLTLTFDEEHDDPQWYLLTDKKDNTLKFNINGNLVESKDANGNKITITYSNKKITKVTDGSGKEYIFSYVDETHETPVNYVRYILHPSGDRTSFEYNYWANLTKITHSDGTTSSFTYEDGGDMAMLTVKDSEDYQLNFEYTPKSSGKQVKTVTEYGKGIQGQKITFDRSKYNTTKIRTAGTDGVFGNSNDLITTYQFDNFGRTVSQQVSRQDGASSVAGTYDYTANTRKNENNKDVPVKSANKVSSAAGLGKNVVNYAKNSNGELQSDWFIYTNSNVTSTLELSTAAAYIGNKSMMINNTAVAAEGGNANLRQNLTDLAAGKSYTLSAYTKVTDYAKVYDSSTTGAYIAASVKKADGTEAVTYSEFINENTPTGINKGWRRLSLTISVPQGYTNVRLYLGYKNCTGKVYFDCIQLEEGTVVNDYNLLENSSFENESGGMPDKWTSPNVSYTLSGSIVKEGVTPTYKKEGSSGFLIKGVGTDKKFAYQTVQVGGSVDDTYILSGWAIANATKKTSQHDQTTFCINIQVVYDDGNGGEHEEYKDPLVFNADFPAGEDYTGWQYSAKAFTLKSSTNASYKPLRVNISLSYNYQVNSVCFDNIQLIKDVAQSYTYDSKGNITSVSANAEQKDSLVYDSKEDLKEYTDALGYKTSYTYDAKHNLTSAKSPGNVLTNYTYNSAGNQTSAVLKDSASTYAIQNETWYTNSAEQDGVTVKAGSYVARTTDEHGNNTVYYYNVLKDLVTKFRNVLNVYTEYVYDDNTEQLKTVKTYKQDASGNNVALSSPVNYTYSGSKLSNINYGSDNYSFTYDNFGNVVSTNVGGKPLSTNTYGANNGVLQKTTYGNGAVKNYTYDTFGNLASVSGSAGTYTWTYDSAMNPMTHVDNVNNLRYNYEYDGIGRLVRQELRTEDNSTHLGATEFAYDLRNNVTKVTNRIGGRTATQSYSYSAISGLTNSTRYAKDNLPVRYSISSSRYITYDYDVINRLSKKTLSLSTPLVWRYVYEVSDRNSTKATGDTNNYTTTQILTEHSGKIAYNYTYDIAGNITSIKYSDANGSGSATLPWVSYRSYTYDDLCQLTSETNATTGKTYTYTYDNVGNITSKSDGTSTITYTYGTDSDAGWSKLLTSYNGESIDYDKIGNPTTYRGATLSWIGRQLNSYNKDGTSINYTYDADGLRGSKTVNGATTTYQYLDGKLYYEDRNGTDIYYYYDSYGTISAITAFLADGRSGTVFVGTNSLGDVNALYDGNGNVVVRYEYDAWGKVLAETDANGNALTGTAATWNEINPFRYRGYVYDAETGLYYLQSRYYDPEVGRFLNADGYVSTGQGALGHNMFAYCGNNPVVNYDPSGQSIIGALVVGGVIIGLGLLLSGCSASSTPEPYNSADDAARGFSEQIYSSSSYVRHEYSTEIYSRTVNGETTYNYNPPRVGMPHSASVVASTPKGTEIVAYAHTHPNSNFFSQPDIDVAENLRIDAYVVGPNLELQRYSFSSKVTTSIGVISPIPLTDAQRSTLVTDFRVSWDAHVSAGCDFECGSMTWPTP